jgi:NAD+-dependent secondary alcohol dehydrogenase Adh1
MDPALPYTIGHENAGWVHEVGSAVTNVAVGDTVILHPTPTCGLCRACRAGQDMHCVESSFPGLDSDGGMAEYLLTSARACVKLDPSTQPKDVAALADAGITAYHAVRKALPLLYPGTTCVVVGAGGLGHIGIQCLAALTSTRIVVLDRNPDALALATELGADEAVVTDGSHVEQVLELTGGAGAEVVIDFVAEQGAELDGPRMLRRAGSYFVIGYGGTVSIPTIDIISTEINVVGNLVGTYNDLAELMVLAQADKVTLHTKTYPLASALDAFADLDTGNVRGRAILVP